VKPPTIKKKRYDTKFQKLWLTDDHFKDWGTQQVLVSGPKLVGWGWVGGETPPHQYCTIVVSSGEFNNFNDTLVGPKISN
jgi:hypothetical protein